MASLGTLAAELKLEGAAGMISGLRAAGGAVSSLGQTLAGVRAPLAQLDGALQAVKSAGAGVNAVAAPIQNAGAALSQFPALASRAAGALQALAKSRAGMLAAFARPAALHDLSNLAVRVPIVGRASRLPGVTPSPGNRDGRPTIAAGPARLTQAASLRKESFDSSGHTQRRPDSVGGLRGVLSQFQARLRGGSENRGNASDAPRLAINAGASRSGEGDRLARVGGFIGGSGGPSVDYHRRTAAATEKSAQTLQTLVQQWAGSNARPPATVWT